MIIVTLLVFGCHKKQILKPADQIPPKIVDNTIGWDQVPELKTVYFETESYVLSPAARQILVNNVKMLGSIVKDLPEVYLGIGGHCDPRGTTDYNLWLGNMRAQAIRNFYLTAGIPFERM